MKTWRSVIIDDEPLAREELRTQLAAFSQIKIIGEAGSYHESIDIIKKYAPDLVFLDIDMGTHSGFDILPEIDNTIKIIFVTAHDEYAIRAFEVNALDYLLKPVWYDRLDSCLKRLGNPYSEKLPEILEHHDQILVKMRSSSRFIKVNEITCIEACADYTRIYSVNKVSGLVHHTLKRWLERLPARDFVRVHKSFIVNTRHVDSIEKDKDEGNFAILRYPEKRIPVSRRYGSQLFASFKV